MRKYDAVVIGSGCAGLAASLELISEGKKTLLIEKHNLPGGCATSFCRGRFEFEPSLHELCGVGTAENPGEVRKIMEKHGVDVKWNYVDDCFRTISVYSDGEPMDCVMPTGKDRFIDAMENYVPGSRQKMNELFELLEEIRDAIDYFADPVDGMDGPVLLKKFPNVLKTGAYSVNKVFEVLGLPQKAQDIFNTYWSYLGVDMDGLSMFHYAAMVYNYIVNGAFIPTHTSHEISNAMAERFRELGGEIWFNCTAEKLIFRNDKCCGVETTMGTVEADVVLANINPDIIYGKMIPDNFQIPEREKKLSTARNREFGARMFTIYLGLNKTAEELGIKDYSIFLAGTADSVKEYKSLEKIDTNEYSIFLCYNIANPNASPEGTAMCSFTTMFTASEDWDKLSQEDYVKVKNALAKKIMDNFKDKTGIDLMPYIEEISVASPWTFARYLNVPEGSVYGYLTKDWDGMMERTLSGENEFPIDGLRPIGTSGSRGDGYSSTYINGSMEGINAVAYLNKLGGAN